MQFIIVISKKAIGIILNKKISNHWKEIIIPKYSMQIFKYALQLLLIFFLITFIFFVINNFFGISFSYIFSLNGIIQTVLITFCYAYIRKKFFK